MAFPFTSREVLTAANLNAALLTAAHTGGTINGVAIGGTAPAAGAFTTLAASGAVTLASTLALTGAATIGGTLGVTGAATIGGTLGVTGLATLASVAISGGTINGATVGATTAAHGHFSNAQIGTSAAMPAAPRRFTAHVSQTLTTGGAVYRWGGAVAGTLAAPLTGYYTTAMDNDTLTFSNTSDGMTLVYEGHALSAGWTGGRTTQQSFMLINGSGICGSDAYLVSGASFIESLAQMGGGIADLRGNVFARNDSVKVGAGSGYHVKSAFGYEVDIAAYSTTEVGSKGGFKVVQWAADAKRGWITDFAIGINNQSNGTAPGWRVGYAVGGYEGWWPFTASSRILGLIRTAGTLLSGAPSVVAGRGLDLTGITLSDSAFASQNFRVDGSGNLGARAASAETLQTRGSILAKTAVVAAIEVLEGGLFVGDITITVPAPGGSGAAATAVPATVAIPHISEMAANGAGYVVGDTFDLVGGTGTIVATGEVTKVNASGGVFGVRITEQGSYSVAPTTPVATSATSGVGTGMTLDPCVTLLTVTVTGGGTNYAEHVHPEPTTTGSTTTFRQAMLKVTMTATQGQLALNNGKINVTGMPTSASGLASGDVWNNAGTLTVVA